MKNENAETPKRRNDEKDCRLAVCDCRLQILDAGAFAAETDLVDVVVSPDGEVQSAKGNFLVDAEAFAEILAAFEKQKVSIPFDYEHQTLGGEFASPDGKAPLAGEIKGLTYVPGAGKGKGVVASVKWTPRARQMIRDGEYIYASPVIVKRDGKVVGLHSVGLTNKPAIVGMERVAAKDALLTEQWQSTNELPAGQRTLTKENEKMDLLKELQDRIGGPTDTAETIVNKVGELKKKAEIPPETAKAVRVANATRKQLGLKEDADEDMVVASIATEKAGTAGLKAMQTELIALKTQMQAKEAEQWVNGYSAKGVVGIGHDDAARKADREMILRMACSNRADCERVLLQRVSVLPPNGATRPPADGEGATSRGQVIASARQEYEESRMMVCSETAYVNTTLREKGLKPLSKKEIEELVAA